MWKKVLGVNVKLRNMEDRIWELPWWERFNPLPLNEEI